MPAGYSGKPLFQKLGIRPGARVAAVAAPAHYEQMLGGLPDGVDVTYGIASEHDVVHLFVATLAELEGRIDELRAAIKPEGMIWVSWPKKTAQVPTDLTEDVVRRVALDHGLVDVKVCAVDEVWSGLKLVIRLRDRPA